MGDVPRLRADLLDAPGDDVIDPGRVQTVAVHEGAEGRCEQVDRMGARQGATGLAFAHGGPYDVDDDGPAGLGSGVWHGDS